MKARKQRIPARVAIVGEPGIGKTVFLENVVSWAGEDGWFVAESACHEIQRNTSFIVSNRLVSAAIRRLGTSANRYISGLEEGLASFDRSIANLLGVPPSPSAPGQDRYRETFLQFFEAIGIDYPLLIACDDVQWLDAQSADMLEALTARIGQCPLVVATTERTNAVPPAARMNGELVLRLFALDFNSTKALVRTLLPHAEQALVETVAHHTRGNPLQTAALCEDLQRDGEARSDRGLHDLIQDRVAEMATEEREFLHTCALLDEPIEFRVLFKLYPDSSRFSELLRASAAPYLVAEGPALRFRHALVLDAVRKTIDFELPLRRKIIAALDSMESPDLTDYERLIAQAEALGDRDLAFRTHLRVAAAAFVRKEWNAVVNACERALALQEPDSAQFVQFFTKYGVALRSLERGIEARDVTRDALRRAEFLELGKGTGALVSLLMAELWVMENAEEAFEVGERYLATAVDPMDRADVLALAVVLSAMSFDEELYKKFDAQFQEVMGDAREYALATRAAAEASMLSAQGDYEKAKRAIRRAITGADLQTSRQSDDLPFMELCIDIREHGCSIAKERLPNLLRQTRFESGDIVYGSLLSAWISLATGDWTDARVIVQNAHANSALGFRASMLAIVAMMSAFTEGNVPLIEGSIEVGLRLIRDGYWMSAAQLIPWLVLGDPRKEFTDFIDRIASGQHHQPHMHIIGYTPAGLSLAALATKNSALIARQLDVQPPRDRSPWALAHSKLARAIAMELHDSAGATDALLDVSKDFSRLAAPFFAAYAANRAGRATPEEQALLQRLGVVSRSAKATPGRRKTAEQRFGLTAREWQVAGLIAEGNTNREIAKTLFLSERTVEVHVSNVLSKLQLGSRTQLTRWMFQRATVPV